MIERTFAWLHGFRRLRTRWERRADIHEAFRKLTCCLIAHRRLGSLCFAFIRVHRNHRATNTSLLHLLQI